MFAPKKNTIGCLSVSSQRGAVRILIADNQELVRDALRPALLTLSDTIQIVECGTFDDAMSIAENPGVTLAVLALCMPGMNGVEGIRVFRDRFPNVLVAALSGSHGVGDIVKAFDYGAVGFISKSNKVASVTSAIGLMLSGQRYVPGEVIDAIQKRSAATMLGAEIDSAPYPLHRLTDREREVLRHLIEGKPNKSIAIALGVQEVTVKLHIRKLLRKLRVTNRTQAVTVALQSGWGSEI